MDYEGKPDIYRQFDAAFANVSAYNVSTADGRNVGRVCFKHGRDGASRLWCYVQVWGAPMVRGYMAGFGSSDKPTLAFEAAAIKLKAGDTPAPRVMSDVEAWRSAAAEGSQPWQRRLEALGYVVQPVVI